MVVVSQPTPMVDVDEMSDESRSLTCMCEACIKARCHCLCHFSRVLFGSYNDSF